MNLPLEIKGACAANISRWFHIPVQVKYTWSDQGESAVIQGVVSGPARFFFSDSHRITRETALVRIPRAVRTETSKQGKKVIEETDRTWLVHTPLVTFRIGRSPKS